MERHVTQLREGGRVGTERLREPALHGNRRMRFEEPHECRKRRRRGGKARRRRRRGRWRGGGARGAPPPGRLSAAPGTLNGGGGLPPRQGVGRPRPPARLRLRGGFLGGP